MPFNYLIQNSTSGDYRFVVNRSDDGKATITLQHQVTTNSVLQWVTATSGTTPVTQSNAGWDDAIPWAAGTYDLTFAGTYVNSASYSWIVPNGEVAGRDGIRLHLGNQAQPSQALEGCIGASTAFLAAAHDVLAAAGEISPSVKIPLVVQDSNSLALFPIRLSEAVSTSTLKPGDTATLTLSLTGNGTANGVTKDIFVHVPITKMAGPGIAAFGTDYTITSTSGVVDELYANYGGSHAGATWPAGEYLLLPAGHQSVTYTITVNPSISPTANELINLTIDNYYVERKRGTGLLDYSDHASPKILLDGASVNGTINITPATLLTSEHLQGDIQGLLKTYAVKLGDTINFGFEAYNIPDFLSITDGTAVYGTGGSVSDYHTGSFKATTSSIVVKVIGSTDGTAWDLFLTDGVSASSTAAHDEAATSTESDVNASLLTSLALGATLQATAVTAQAVSSAATASVAVAATTAATMQLISSTKVTIAAVSSATPVTFSAVAGQSYLMRVVGAELRPQTDTLVGGTLGVYENTATVPSYQTSGTNLFGEAAAWFTATSAESVRAVARASFAGGTAEVEIYNVTNVTRPILYLQQDVTDAQTRGSEQGMVITARRVGNLAQAATYLLNIVPTGSSPITAADLDGGSLQRSVTFAVGEDLATVIVYPQLSAAPTGLRTATVMFDPATVPADQIANGALLGLPESLTLTIGDAPQHSTLVIPTISSADAAGTVRGGSVVFDVKLSVPSSNPVSVSYVTNDMTAVSGTDYVQKSGTVTFQPGETTAQVTVPLLAGGGGGRTFQLNLLSPFGGTLPANASVMTKLGSIGGGVGNSVYRFFDTTFGTHLFTQSLSEAQQIIASRPDLTQETNGFGAVSANATSAQPVYRFFETSNGTHFFTSSQAEFLGLTTQGSSTYRSDFTYEASSTFYEDNVKQTGDVPVYRLFDSVAGTQFLTGDGAEYAGLTTAGSASYRPDLRPEGIAFYAPQGTFRA